MLLVSQPSVIHSKLTKANMNNTCILGLQHVNFLHVCAYLQSILNLIGRFLPSEPKVTRYRRHGKRRKHCIKCNPSKSCVLYNVVHSVVLQRPAIRKSIGLTAVATFIFFIIYTLEGLLGANCHQHPRLIDGLPITMSATHEPIHGHVTANCQEYHDIPLKRYEFGFCNRQHQQ